MYQLKALFCVLCIAVLFSGCAGSYRTINPDRIPYQQQPENLDAAVEVGYHYNILTELGNKKFARKEKKKNLNLVAVKITNNTDRTLIFGKDILFRTEGQLISPVSHMRTFRTLKHKTPLFLLYLPLVHLNVTTIEQTNSGYKQRFYPVGLIVGPILSFGNMFKAHSNNKKFLKELKEYNLQDKAIKPGETVYGLLGVQKATFKPIEAEMRVKGDKIVQDDYYIEGYE
ncbi:hypothetical protein D770_16630 [Flammeovirgaceae bacterium 311]|nr:hypothetical protein D770_16630 [Flammeovirgaceae bacterium 311]